MTAPEAGPANPYQPPTEAAFLRPVQMCEHQTPRLIPVKPWGQWGHKGKNQGFMRVDGVFGSGDKTGTFRGQSGGTLTM